MPQSGWGATALPDSTLARRLPIRDYSLSAVITRSRHQPLAVTLPVPRSFDHPTPTEPAQ